MNSKLTIAMPCFSTWAR